MEFREGRSQGVIPPEGIARIERDGEKGEVFGDKALAIKDLERYPTVIAKGRGELARTILKIAKECGIPIYDDPDLFEALSVLDVGVMIPDELYGLVSNIVSFIYKTNIEFRDGANGDWKKG